MQIESTEVCGAVDLVVFRMYKKLGQHGKRVKNLVETWHSKNLARTQRGRSKEVIRT